MCHQPLRDTRPKDFNSRLGIEGGLSIPLLEDKTASVRDGVPPEWRPTRSVGQPVAGRAPGVVRSKWRELQQNTQIPTPSLVHVNAISYKQ